MQWMTGQIKLGLAEMSILYMTTLHSNAYNTKINKSITIMFVIEKMLKNDAIIYESMYKSSHFFNQILTTSYPLEYFANPFD